MRDTYHSHKAVLALAPAVQADSVDGAAIDIQGFDSALIVVNTGAVAGSGNFGAKLQESDTTTGGDFTDVAAADQLGTFPATLVASTAYRVGYIGSKRKRFIRVVLTKASGTSIAAGVVAILSNGEREPIA